MSARARWALLAVVAVALLGTGTSVAADAPGYDYDGDRTAVGMILEATPETAAELGQQLGGSADKSRGHAYDHPSQLARASAPAAGYGSAPNTLGSGVRGLANAGDELAQGGVYALRDPVTGQVVRNGTYEQPVAPPGRALP